MKQLIFPGASSFIVFFSFVKQSKQQKKLLAYWYWNVKQRPYGEIYISKDSNVSIDEKVKYIFRITNQHDSRAQQFNWLWLSGTFDVVEFWYIIFSCIDDSKLPLAYLNNLIDRIG